MAIATPWTYSGLRALTLISRVPGPLRSWSCCPAKGPGCAAATLRSGASEGGGGRRRSVDVVDSLQ
eukprot:15002167-Alexandrium_andersonii.AAC.1